MDRASPTEIRWLSGAIPGWWRALLHEWGRLMEGYCRFHRADAPYWYGEIPLTGLLVAAAWRLPDGWALGEFSAPRKQGDKRIWGAADAWLGQGEASWCAVEAKLPQIFTIDLEDATRTTRYNLDLAKEALASLEPEYRGEHPIAICYVVPNLLQDGRDTTPERIQALFEGLAAHFRNERSMIAIYRPPGDGYRIDEGRVWPGVVLVGEAVA